MISIEKTLSDTDIETMVQDAETHAEDDKKRRETIDLRNNADSLIHSSEKSLSEFGDKISEDDKSSVETAIADLKASLEGDSAEEIKTKTDALTQASMKLGEAMYKSSQENVAEPGSVPDTDDAAKNDGANETVVDADFEEVNPDTDSEKKDNT